MLFCGIRLVYIPEKTSKMNISLIIYLICLVTVFWLYFKSKNYVKKKLFGEEERKSGISNDRRFISQEKSF
jgi:hypothetical protein